MSSDTSSRVTPESPPISALVATEVEPERRLAEQLMARAKEEGVDLVGPEGLLTKVTKSVLEAALAGELTEHLGYEPHDPAGRGSANSRNGMTRNLVHTDVGPVTLDIPRDRAGTFE